MSVINGVVTGTVTAVDDRDGEGRIRVRFDWLDVEHQTDWIRIATPMAGNGRGFFAIPELEDEVLLGFEHGDVRCPYVLGYLWNGVDDPAGQHVRQRTWRSVQGHHLTFYDATPSGGSVGALVIQDGHGNAITMSNGKITIKSVGTLELEAANIVLQGPRQDGEPLWRRVVASNDNGI